jgi:CheY-like chemotaxis protein
MSHELRTPLNAIIGFGQLLEMDELSDDQNEQVQHILTGGQHLLNLINEVLDMARIEAGQLQLSLEPVAVSAALHEAVDLVRPLSAQRNVSLRCADAKQWRWHVLADQQRFKQVLLNLLANAIKYNHIGGEVVITCTQREDQLQIAISDSGVGISNENLQRLFVPFERLEVDTSMVEGTGLGLALSKRLIEAMGGSIFVESTLGRGSTFSVVLPLAISPMEQMESAGTSATASTEVNPPAHTVLYVEDNLSNLSLIKHLFAKRPHIHLITAMQGRMGLDLAREHRPDLILLDLHLPDVPGWEVLRLLQEEPATATIPVVIVSADATAPQVQRLLEAGARAYLTKPLDVKKFLQTLEETLG